MNKLPFAHTWNLERLFSLGSSTEKMLEYSGVFFSEGNVWKLALRPSEAEAKEGKKYLSLFLVPVGAVSPPACQVELSFESTIISKNYNLHSEGKATHEFGHNPSEKCSPDVVSLVALECPSSGFLVAEIINFKVHQLPKEDLHHPASHKSRNEYPPPAYMWRINGFPKLTKMSYNSEPFLHDDRMWRVPYGHCKSEISDEHLTLFPKGKPQLAGKHVAVYLELDDASTLAPSMEVHAYSYVDLVDQIGGQNHRLEGEDVFDSNKPAWGWIEYLPLECLNDPSHGFMVNDTCIIQVGFKEVKYVSK